MRTETLSISTGPTSTVVDLTRDAARFVATAGEGLLNVFVPHATAGIAIIETGAGSDTDLLDAIERILPRDDGLYRHRHGATGDGADLVLPAWLSPSAVVPVVDGRLMLGSWQSIVVFDSNVDNRLRRVVLSFVEG